jgi:predicted TIM-barrel fold metal-dependent hydrolase
MNPEAIFSICNFLAMAGWLLLIFAPRARWSSVIVASSLIPLEAPRVPVQIAHLTGAGGYDDPAIDEALGIFADAIANHDRRMKRVYFDISGITGIGEWKQRRELIATRVRQLGLNRVLFGSDGAIPGNSPYEYWTRFRQLPLSDSEFQTIERNIAPHMK